jgi:hypothetical protein
MADDPGEPTTTVTATPINPDPAPPPTPKPKPKPVQTTPHTQRPVYTPPSRPTYTPPSTSGSTSHAPAVVHTQKRPTKKKAAHRPKKKVHKKKVAAKPKPKTTTVTQTVPALKPAVPVAASSGLPLRPSTTGKGLLYFIVVAALSCAIACLSAAVIPAKHFRWRPAALFVWDRQLQLAAVGLALLAAAAMTLIVSSGS